MICSESIMALTQKERSAISYKKRKENGLCPRCGKLLDREGHYCSECNTKHNEYMRETRAFLRKQGMCPVCGKEKLFGDEKQCISCRQKAYDKRKPLTEEQKNRRNIQFREQQNSVYRERSENGICTRCGKYKAEKGKKKCRICLDKDAEMHRKRTYNKKSVREYRKENHLCYHCGKEIDRETGEICQSCWERFRQAGLKSASRNEYWKNDNKIVFKNG